MKVTLIKPNIGRLEHSLYVDSGRMEPLQLGVLAALTPPDAEVVVYDDRMEPIPYDEPTDLAAITVETFTARRAYEIAAEFRQRGVPVILGGIHPTLLPEEAAQHADSLYLGDAEFLWTQVLDDCRRGRLQPLYQAPVGPPQPGTLTRRDLFRGKGYLPLALLQFSRGCGFDCTYCAVSAYFHKTHYLRAVREVVAEIESQPRRLLFFVDDNMLWNREAAKALCRELIPLRIRWVSQASIDMTEDRELMELMAKSGCLGHVIGFESLNPENIRDSRKAPNLTNAGRDYREPLKVLRDYGLQVWAAFTCGYDHDTRDSIERTVDFAIDNKFCFAAFNILMPYPRTAFYETLRAEGRLLYDGQWWLHPEYRFNHAAFQPRGMSAEELTDVCFQARRRFNSFGSIILRACDWRYLRSPYRLGLYLRYNPLFRRETFKKQGMRFGLR